MGTGVFMFMRRVCFLAFSVAVIAVAAQGAESDFRLLEASARQEWQTVRVLLSESADVNVQRADGATALLWAAHWDDFDTVARLLEAGADANAADDHGVTPLMRASENASNEVVEALLDAGADANATQTSGLTALMIAARTGSRDLVRLLLSYDADINAATHETGVTALMWAVQAPHPDIVHVLLETGAEVEVSSAKGFTPLLFAARNGDIPLAGTLIAAGADVNGDGFADVLMGAGLYDAGQTDEGVVFVYHGEFNPGGSPNQVPVAYAGTDQSVQDADGNTAMRNYSLSNAPGASAYRISVKRELGGDDAPNGDVSNRIHDGLAKGDRIELSPPCGAFTLELPAPAEKPLVFIAGGVGITLTAGTFGYYLRQKRSSFCRFVLFPYLPRRIFFTINLF